MITDRTDKYANGYVPMYLNLAAGIGTAGRVMELGVQGGGSLELWLTLFPRGIVVGVDRNAESVWPAGSVMVVCDQSDTELVDVSKAYGPFDIIVDDASHLGDKTDESFELLWPHVKPGGFYVVEDWLVAFIGRAPMYEPEMLNFATSLLTLFADKMDDVEEILFREGQIILRKKAL